jgi:hypothetical protein
MRITCRLPQFTDITSEYVILTAFPQQLWLHEHASLILTYLLSPRSRVLLEKLTDFPASEKIRRMYGTRKFITVLTRVRHLSLSWAHSIQSPQPPLTSWRSILILSSHLRVQCYVILTLSLLLFYPTTIVCKVTDEIPPRVWEVGRVGYISTMNKAVVSGNR